MVWNQENLCYHFEGFLSTQQCWSVETQRVETKNQQEEEEEEEVGVGDD